MPEVLEKNPLASRAAEALEGLVFYFVGGIVRDALLGKPCLDVDIVLVPATSDPLRELKSAIGKLAKTLSVKPTRSQFLTGKFVLDRGEIDIALARKEEYPEPGSLPVVTPATSLEEDLKRRDFTANAIAMTPSGGLIDPLGGAMDVGDRILRVIHRGSFKDDPTRAIRAIRYKHQLEFSYSGDIEEEFALARRYLAGVSFERIKHELMRSSGRPERAYVWLEIMERNLLGNRIPDRKALLALSERATASPESWVLFYGLVSESAPSGLTRIERKILDTILRNTSKEFKSIGDAHEALRTAPDEALLALGVLNPLVEDYRQKRHLAKPLTGPEEMKAMGFSGKNLGRAILALEKSRLEGKIKTRADEREFLINLP